MGLSAEMRSATGYIASTAGPFLLLVGAAFQDGATMRGQADVPKTFREKMADAIPQKWRRK